MKMYFIARRDLPFEQALAMGSHTLGFSPSEAWIRHTGIHIIMGADYSPTEQTRQVQAWSDRGYGPSCVEVSEFVVDESAADMLAQTRPLTEGRFKKGGVNKEPSKVVKRPPPPGRTR